MTILQLMYEFFKTGLFSVGGGLATLPFLYEMSSRHPDWFTTADIADMIAISESTPGPIGINMATYVGCNIAGVFGGFIATMGELIPSLIIVILIQTVGPVIRENIRRSKMRKLAAAEKRV